MSYWLFGAAAWALYIALLIVSVRIARSESDEEREAWRSSRG